MSDGNGLGEITPLGVDNGSIDNCSIDNYSLDIDTFGCDDIGANTVILTATDAGGNSESCSSIITVVDSVNPVANCQDITVLLDGSGNATIIGDDINNGSTDACGIASLSVSPNSFDIGDLGDNLVTLTVTDVNGNSTTCTAIVTVTEFLSTESVLTTENVKIYPNPTEEFLIISFPRELEVSIHLFDLVGKLIQSQNNVIVSKTHSMNISYLNTGTYFVRIKSEIGIVTKRIIKE